jgi:hypothetical protein
MAVNSMYSPRLPNVISEESSTAKGKAREIMVIETRKSNFPMMKNSKPLPTKSSTYFQTNCMSRMKSEMKKVSTNGPR